MERTPDNDLQVPLKLVSRHHSRLLTGPYAVIPEDLGSTNGSFINGRCVKKQLLRDGVVVMIGESWYKFDSRSGAPIS